MNIHTELNSRDVNDTLIACNDDFKGFPEAINTLPPETSSAPYCAMVRNSMKYVARKDYKTGTAGLKRMDKLGTKE
ncbi:MAG: transposase [Colwellia sp.]|nr:transposase [Colwellia sp.]